MPFEEWHLTWISNALGVVFAILILALLRRVVCGSKSTGLGNTVLVLGHTGAGKTALVRRLLRGGFPTTCVSMKEAVFDGVRLACEAEDGSTAGGPLRKAVLCTPQALVIGEMRPLTLSNIACGE